MIVCTGIYIYKLNIYIYTGIYIIIYIYVYNKCLKSNKKIKDFGLSRSVEGREEEYVQVFSKAIPFRWSAPETLGQRKSSTKSDVWMLGKNKTITKTIKSLYSFSHSLFLGRIKKKQC